MNLDMNLDWRNVRGLASPIQAAKDDVIFSGHGIYQSDGDLTTVPDGVELWLLTPLGASVAYATGRALANMEKISELAIKNLNSNILVENAPVIYPAGSAAPNLILPVDRRITIKPGNPHILGVKKTTKLSELWELVMPLAQRKNIRCYWAACDTPKDAGYAVVLHK